MKAYHFPQNRFALGPYITVFLFCDTQKAHQDQFRSVLWALNGTDAWKRTMKHIGVVEVPAV